MDVPSPMYDDDDRNSENAESSSTSRLKSQAESAYMSERNRKGAGNGHKKTKATRKDKGVSFSVTTLLIFIFRW